MVDQEGGRACAPADEGTLEGKKEEIVLLCNDNYLLSDDVLLCNGRSNSAAG